MLQIKCKSDNRLEGLVAGFSFEEVVPRQSSHDVFSSFIVEDEQDGEGNCREPPVELQGHHSEGDVHAWAVAEEDSDSQSQKERNVEERVTHTLKK